MGREDGEGKVSKVPDFPPTPFLLNVTLEPQGKTKTGKTPVDGNMGVSFD